MKKLLAFVLCLLMLFAMTACVSQKVDDTTTGADEVTDTTENNAAQEDEHAGHNHISYRDCATVFTPEQLVQIEGREHDFTYEQNEATIYIYNGITVDTMEFTQAQFSFDEDHNRISCTYTADKGTEDAPKSAEDIQKETDDRLASYIEVLTQKYGEGVSSTQHGNQLTSWSDHTGNYIIVTRINDTTIQVAFYIYAQ